MNRLLLEATLVERGAMRFTPAGLPVLDFALRHESALAENGTPRKVLLQIRSVAIGRITAAVAAMRLGEAAVFSGFLAPARNGRGLLFHVTALEAATH